MNNRMRLLWAGFAAIFAAGVGFAIRGGIFANWAADFGFNGAQLGAIGGAGFTGFCFGIIIGGVVADKLGYGKLVAVAFLLHVGSAFVTFAATKGQAQEVAFNYLKWGMFLFAMANGVLEGVANPLVATLFPENRTHYLNILHASWPAGLVAGGAAGWLMGKESMFGGVEGVSWKIQLGLYLIPTVLYGVMFLGQKMPQSEASEKGLSLGEMFKDVGLLASLVICGLIALFVKDQLGLPPAVGYAVAGALWLVVGAITGFSIGAWLLFVLFVAHALVGAVELGTDGWIQNITGNILTPGEGKILFVLTSLGMFGLRFCAHFIEKNLKLSPPALLFVCAVLAAIGLNLVSGISTFGGAVMALAVYCLGKTFFWPTMLAVASDRFPRTGAIAISIMGGIGMMSAGLIGSAGLGYAKDRFASEELAKKPALYAQYKSDAPSKFLVLEEVHGIDGAKLSKIQDKKAEERSAEEKEVHEAGIVGDRRTLVADSFIPMAMAAIYLLLVLYFKATGGYKAVRIDGSEVTAEAPKEEAAAH